MSLLLHPPLPKSLTLERASQQRFKACPPFRSLTQTCSLDTAGVLLEILGNNLLTLVQIMGYALPGLRYQTWFCTGDRSVSFWAAIPNMVLHWGWICFILGTALWIIQYGSFGCAMKFLKADEDMDVQDSFV